MRLNVRLLACTLVALILVAVGGYFLHAFQVKRNAGSLRDLADKDREAGNLELAAAKLKQYVGLVPTDSDALVELADVLEQMPNKSPRDQFTVLELYDKAVRLAPDRDEFRLKAVEKAMALGRWSDAKIHIEKLLEKPSTDARMYDWRGQCYEAEGNFSDAKDSYRKAIYVDPEFVDLYYRLAVLEKLHPDEGKDNLGQTLANMTANKIKDKEDKEIEVNNHRNVSAYLNRVRYNLRFPPSKDDDKQDWVSSLTKDMTTARKVAADPNNPQPKYCKDLKRLHADVLFFSALASQLDNAPQEQALFLEQGAHDHPDDFRFYEALANAYVQARRFDDAANILQKFLDLDAKPSAQVAAQTRFQLGEVLIASGKLDDARKLTETDQSSTLAALLRARILVVERNWRAASRLLEQT
jgi:tetratricopeptide (TPR) repeat protein